MKAMKELIVEMLASKRIFKIVMRLPSIISNPVIRLRRLNDAVIETYPKTFAYVILILYADEEGLDSTTLRHALYDNMLKVAQCRCQMKASLSKRYKLIKHLIVDEEGLDSFENVYDKIVAAIKELPQYNFEDIKADMELYHIVKYFYKYSFDSTMFAMSLLSKKHIKNYVTSISYS